MMWMNVREKSLRLWGILDPIYFRFTRLEYVHNHEGKPTLVRVRLTKYKGMDVILRDGTEIKKNDLLLKIHLHNIKLLKRTNAYNSDMRKAIVIVKSVKDSLPDIVRYIEKNHYTEKIKGLIGITMLHKGCTKLGFDSFPIKNRIYKFLKKSALLPIHLLSTGKMGKEIPDPMYLFMSKQELFRHYSQRSNEN